MSQLFQSFIFKSRTKTVFARLNPATVLFLYVFLALADLLSFNLTLLTAQTVISSLIVILTRAPLRFVRLFLIIAAWFGLVLGLVTIFFGLYPGRIIYSFEFAGALVRITSGNFINGISILIKLFNLGMLTAFYVFVADPRSIVSAMETIKVPFKFSLSLALVFRNLAIFAGDFEIINQAQRSRGLDINKGSIFQRAKKYVNIVIPLVFLALKRADDLVNALDTKGYDAKTGRTSYYSYRLKALDYAVVVLSALFVILVMVYTFFPYLIGIVV